MILTPFVIKKLYSFFNLCLLYSLFIKMNFLILKYLLSLIQFDLCFEQLVGFSLIFIN